MLNVKFSLALMFCAVLVGCGGGGTDSSSGSGGGGGVSGGNGGGTQAHTPIAAVSFTDFTNKLSVQFPQVPSSLITEMRGFSANESSIDPSMSTTYFDGVFRSDADPNGFVRYVDANFPDRTPIQQVFRGPTLQGFLSLQGGPLSVQMGTGSTYLASNGINSPALVSKMYWGYPAGQPTDGSASKWMLVLEGIAYGQDGAAAGRALMVYTGMALTKGPTSFLNQSPLQARYRMYALEDFLGGPTGLRLDFDAVLNKCAAGQATCPGSAGTSPTNP